MLKPELPTTAAARTTSRIIVWTGIALLSLASSGQAQGLPTKDTATNNTQDVTGLSLEQLLTVEVESVFGATKSLQKITEAPAAVTIITAEEIRRFGWRTMAEVMRSVRGFYVTTDRGFSNIGVRGFQRPGDANNRLLVTVDGRRTNDNIFDRAAFDDELSVDLGAVERIEIIRGPSSSLYGSSAFFAVINVVTRAAAEGRRAEVMFGGGSLDAGEARFRVRHDVRPDFAVSLSGVAKTEHGNSRLYFPEYDTPFTNFGVAENLDYARRKSLFARADRGHLTLTAGFNERTRGNPTGAYGVVFNRGSYMTDRRLTLGGQWSGDVKGWSTTVNGAFDSYRFTGRYPYEWPFGSGVVLDFMDNGLGKWWTTEAQFSRVFAARHHVTAGVEYRRNGQQDQNFNVRDPYLLMWSDERNSNTAGIYAQDQIHLTSRLLVNIGVRQDLYSEFNAPLKPRIAAIFNPRNDTTLKLAYGSAFRAPTIYEAYFTIPGLWMPTADLQPEQIQTVEGILEHYAGKRLHFTASVFHYQVSNLIDSTLDPLGQVNFTNYAEAHSTGYEVEAEAKWPGGVQARLSYTFADSADGMELPLSNSPKHLVQALFSTPLPRGAFASFEMQSVSGRYTRNGDVITGYLLPNFTVSVPVTRNSGQVGVSVRNLTNTRFSDPVGPQFYQETIEQNGRTVRAFLTLAF